ncbi:Vascular endothelial growth factor receptor 3-like protein, partial [Dinothrombium tinctorium]
QGNEKAVKIENNQTQTPEGEKWVSELIIDSPFVSDQTGLFKCHYNDSSDVENENHVYVFVNNKNALLAPEPDTVLFSPIKPLIIPCRPSTSYANVSFWYDAPIGPSAKRTNVIVDRRRGITFDPAIGIRFEKLFVHSNMNFFCEVSLKDKKEKAKFITVYVSSDHYTTLNVKSPPPVLVNESLKLECKIQSFKNESYEIDFGHSNLNQSESMTSELKIEQNFEQNREFYTYSRELTVDKVNSENEGIYYCVVTANNITVDNITKLVTIYDKSLVHFIEMSPSFDLNETVVRQVGEDFQLSVSVRSFPQIDLDRVSLYKNGVVISLNESSIYKMSFQQNTIIVDMKNLSLEQTGFYMLVISPKYHKNVTLNLKIEGKPEMILYHSSQITNGSWSKYDSGSMFEFECIGKGSPIPIVNVFFSACKQKNSSAENCEEDQKAYKWVTKHSTERGWNLESYNYTDETRVKKLCAEMQLLFT